MKLSAFKKVKNILFSRKPTVSFCIPCGNRFWQISQTLPQNLKDNYKDRKNVEFILVDYASTDGLQEWVRDNFQEELKSGYLKYYYTEEMPKWHMPTGKNTPHRLANNKVLVNLDCDNFTGPRGGDYVSRLMWKYGVDKVVLHMGYGPGLCGRVALSRSNFFKAGGYDEALGAFGQDDMDLLNRAQGLGLSYLLKWKEAYTSVIHNETGLGITTDDLQTMRERNHELSEKNVAEGRFVANLGKDMIGVHAVRMFHK